MKLKAIYMAAGRSFNVAGGQETFIDAHKADLEADMAARLVWVHEKSGDGRSRTGKSVFVPFEALAAAAPAAAEETAEGAAERRRRRRDIDPPPPKPPKAEIPPEALRGAAAEPEDD